MRTAGFFLSPPFRRAARFHPAAWRATNKQTIKPVRDSGACDVAVTDAGRKNGVGHLPGTCVLVPSLPADKLSSQLTSQRLLMNSSFLDFTVVSCEGCLLFWTALTVWSLSSVMFILACPTGFPLAFYYRRVGHLWFNFKPVFVCSPPPHLQRILILSPRMILWI